MAARARRTDRRTTWTETARTAWISCRLLSLRHPCGLILAVSAWTILGLGLKTAVPSDPGAATGLLGSREAIVDAARFGADRRLADECFMLREQADFLLTPALLVQEATCDDVVPTYPEE